MVAVAVGVILKAGPVFECNAVQVCSMALVAWCGNRDAKSRRRFSSLPRSDYGFKGGQYWRLSPDLEGFRVRKRRRRAVWRRAGGAVDDELVNCK